MCFLVHKVPLCTPAQEDTRRLQKSRASPTPLHWCQRLRADTLTSVLSFPQWHWGCMVTPHPAFPSLLPAWVQWHYLYSTIAYFLPPQLFKIKFKFKKYRAAQQVGGGIKWHTPECWPQDGGPAVFWSSRIQNSSTNKSSNTIMRTLTWSLVERTIQTLTVATARRVRQGWMVTRRAKTTWWSGSSPPGNSRPQWLKGWC